MTRTMMNRIHRPSWMMPFGHEGMGDVFFDRLWPEWRRDLGEEWSPNMDFSEKDGKYFINAEIPGIDKDDISITFKDGHVTISGKKENYKEEDSSDYFFRETKHGFFCRSFRLPRKMTMVKQKAL